MADQPNPDSNSDIGGTPRWVKVFGIAAVVLLLLVLILMFTRGHTPSRHFGGQAFPSSMFMDGDRADNGPPEDRHG